MKRTLLNAVKLAYRKHCLGDDGVGWDALGDFLCDALCNEMGDEGFQKWLREESYKKEREDPLGDEHKA